MHRVEEGALTDLDQMVQLVEGGVEPCHPQRPLVDVGGDDVPRVAGQVKRLDSAAGAEVEAPADPTAEGELRQGRRGRADAEDVVRTDPLRGTSPGRSPF